MKNVSLNAAPNDARLHFSRVRDQGSDSRLDSRMARTAERAADKINKGPGRFMQNRVRYIVERRRRRVTREGSSGSYFRHDDVTFNFLSLSFCVAASMGELDRADHRLAETSYRDIRSGHYRIHKRKRGKERLDERRRRMSEILDAATAIQLSPALVVKSLVKTFSRQGRAVQALDDFNLTVHEGEFVAIVGPSGCGKSTFLHMLGGFEPSNGGTIELDAKPITGPGPDRGMLFQDYALYPWRTVYGNIIWPLEVQHVPKAERAAIVERFMSLVGLTHFRDHYPAELSGGMKQRVALARVLAFDPKILLMDEPFGALDAQNRELMQEELSRIWDRTRKTVIFVTHDIDEAIYLADRVIVFTARPGRIKQDVKIELPRPRGPDIRKSPEYTQYRNLIWDLLREEVMRAREEYN